MWDLVYKKAINEDGSLLFPKKLTKEFLDKARRTLGSYFFANQYLNEILPSDQQIFRPEWFRYYETLPKLINVFAFVDPAISLEDTADFTGVVVIAVDTTNTRYVLHASRHKITPTATIDLIFKIQEQFKPQAIGVETVAYQKALIYMLDTECKRRGVILPIKEVNPDTSKTKEMKIMGLVPVFEWGRIYLKKQMRELEDELTMFPRGSHDDIIDALASLEQVIMVPMEPKKPYKPPIPSQGEEYEQWSRRQAEKNQGNEYASYDD